MAQAQRIQSLPSHKRSLSALMNRELSVINNKPGSWRKWSSKTTVTSSLLIFSVHHPAQEVQIQPKAKFAMVLLQAMDPARFRVTSRPL
jgi:hypothetical protein